jgi:hypothetical protein
MENFNNYKYIERRARKWAKETKDPKREKSGGAPSANPAPGKTIPSGNTTRSSSRSAGRDLSRPVH